MTKKSRQKNLLRPGSNATIRFPESGRLLLQPKMFFGKKLKNEISNKMCLVRVSRDVGISLMLQQTGNI